MKVQVKCELFYSNHITLQNFYFPRHSERRLAAQRATAAAAVLAGPAVRSSCNQPTDDRLSAVDCSLSPPPPPRTRSPTPIPSPTDPKGIPQIVPRDPKWDEDDRPNKNFFHVIVSEPEGCARWLVVEVGREGAEKEDVIRAARP